MLLRSILTYVVVAITTFQVKGDQDAFKDGPLEVKSVQTFKIDTTTLKANVSQERENISLAERNGIATFNGKNYTYSVAELKYKGSITFQSNSRVEIVGHRALSIQSSHGNITIATNISMVCKEKPDRKRWKTCLGGYMARNTTKRTHCDYLYEGLGPGGSLLKYCKGEYSNEACNDGAGHGGGGGKLSSHKSGKPYGKNDFASLVGGSAGNTKNNDSLIPFSGGGAIEIKAINGSIYIDALIDASARNGYGNYLQNSTAFSGSSGGLIRLEANKVEMRKNGALSVDGSDGKVGVTIGSNYRKSGNGGGGGGIIQVAASQVLLYNLSLAAGESYKCNDSGNQPEDGVLIVKINGQVEVNQSTSFLPILQLPVPPPTIDEQLTEILRKARIIKTKLNNGDVFLNYSEIFNLTQLMQIICKENNLTENHLVTFIDIYDAFEYIVKMLPHQIVNVTKPQDVFDALLSVATAALSSYNQDNWKKTDKLPAFIQKIEAMAVRIANNTSQYHTYTDLIAVQSQLLEGEEDEVYKLPHHSKLPQHFLSEDYLLLPRKALPHRSGIFKAVALLFKHIETGWPDSKELGKENRSDPTVVSLLASYTLLYNGDIVRELKSPAFLYFKHYKNGEGKAKCSFWNVTKEIWDVKGVSVGATNNSNTMCKTEHFTNFAVLMQFTSTQDPPSEAVEMSLLLITYLGFGISILSIVITLIVFLTNEALSTERHRIHLNLIIALLCAQVFFLLGIKAKEQELLCRIVAGVLHYFYLASFAWMLIEGVHLYLKVVRVFGVENAKMRYYYVSGWVGPALLVGIAASIKPYGYGTAYVCWLSLEDGFVWAFIGPVLFTIFVNCLILCIVIKTVMTSASTAKSSDYSHIKAGIKSAIVLMPLMGVTWLFGLFAVNEDTIVFQYIFAICNSLQGFFIFLFHVLFNNEVRTVFKRHLQKRQLSKESADYNASYTSSSESDGKYKHNKGSSRNKSSNSDDSKRGFMRLKERLSLSMMPRTSRVISVQPFQSKGKDNEVQVERKLKGKKT